MDATELTEVCRLCPISKGQNLLNVFDKQVSFKYKIREVILLTTGIEILENDLVSKKICQRCCEILLKMFEFRLDAIKHDRALKEKCSQYLGDKGIRLPNTCITIKKEASSLPRKKLKIEPDLVQPSTSNEDFKKGLHPSIANIYKTYPHLKLPKRSFDRDIAPVVSLTMGEVETYFKKRTLDIKKFIYRPRSKIQPSHKVAKKRTSFPTKPKTVAPLKISKKLFENHKQPLEASSDKDYLFTSSSRKSRKRVISSSDSDGSIESSKLSQNRQAKGQRRVIYSSSDSDKRDESKISQNNPANGPKRTASSSNSDNTADSKSLQSNQVKSLSVPKLSSDSDKRDESKVSQNNSTKGPKRTASSSNSGNNSDSKSHQSNQVKSLSVPKLSSDKRDESKVSQNNPAKGPKRTASSNSGNSADSKSLQSNQVKSISVPKLSSDSDKRDESKVYQSAKGPKRTASSSNSGNSADSKSLQSNQVKYLSVPKLVVETPKPTVSPVVKTPPLVITFTNSVAKTSQVRTPSPAPTDPLSERSRSPSPVSADLMSGNSRDSCSTTMSETTTSSRTSKPEFTESAGLTSRVTATKSHTLLVCNLCGSVHHNAYELKKHTKKHMVCQFCKLKFKSVDAKENHVDNSCELKKIMNAPGPIVALEKLHLNLEVRKKYRDAFSTFKLIPGLVDPTPVEHVILESAWPSPPVAADDVIILSDEDDESSARLADPLSGFPTPSAHMPSPAVENIVYNTVSIVRPDIRIKNNTILDNVEEGVSDEQLLKYLIGVFKPQQSTTVEKMLQTDLPANKDITIISEGVCEFKDLKGPLATYKIPVTMRNGPFQVVYQLQNNSKTKKSKAWWNDLPVIDVGKKTAAEPQNGNESVSSTSSLITCIPRAPFVVNSQVQSVDTSVSTVPVMTTSVPAIVLGSRTTNPAVSTISSVITSSGLAKNISTCPAKESNPATHTLNNTIHPIDTSNSATPLLQNYALSVTPAPVVNKPMPIPRTFVSSALSNTASTSNRTMSFAISTNFGSRPTPSLTPSFNTPQLLGIFKVNRPANTSVVNSPGPPIGSPGVLSVCNQQSTNTDSTNILPFSTTNSVITQPTSSPLAATPKTTPSITENSKFRVKSVWELQ